MFTKRVWMKLVVVIAVASMILGACSAPQIVEKEKIVTQIIRETQVVTQREEVVKTVEVPKDVVVTPTASPITRKGGWMDMIVVVEEPSTEAAVSRLGVSELDLYAMACSETDVFADLQKKSELTYNQAIGGYDVLIFNPVGPTFPATGKLNPFSSPKVRQAMNWLIDRNYIGQEIMGGLGQPRLVPLTFGFPDYVRNIEKVRELEALYAYNMEKAQQVISDEMIAMGAVQVNGKWQYNNEPVEIIFLIRTEDERLGIGDYVSTQLEAIGFTVTRQYKTSREASPIWYQGNPADGLFHVYTGGYITTQISRDDGGNFDSFYNPRSDTAPLYQAYTPTPEFDTLSDRLFRNDFTTLEERKEMFSRALELALEDSVQLFLVDETTYSPYRADVNVTADLAGGIQGTWLWGHTIRRGNQPGGALTIANSSILTNPWNPVGGSNWVYDMMYQRAIADRHVFADPYTGLFLPQRIERAEVFVQEGLPVTKTLDWVSLEFVPENKVPEDAWVDWDAQSQKFITAAEKNPDGLTAKAKVVVYYPPDLYNLKWHDGSNFSVADIVMGWIMNFDTGKPDSPIFDEAQVPSLASTMASFRGLRIAQMDPLVIEYYTDQYYLDAEDNIGQWNIYFFPTWRLGTGAWHNLGLGYLAEASKELAFTSSKADTLGVDYMSFIGGPSLDILNAKLEQAIADNYIPYAATLGQFITTEEARVRWANLQEWYRKHEHFWIGTGPYYLDKVFPIEGTLILKNNPDYPDNADKWLRFSAPRIPLAEITGSNRVTIGQEATFDVLATFDGAPYPAADLSEVKYLVFDAKGTLAFSGTAVATSENGKWQIVLSKEQTAKLEAGANRLEVIVVSKLVSIPAILSRQFVTAP